MDVLDLLKRALKTCLSVIKFGAGIQESARKDLANDLQTICLNCEKAYETVLRNLVPIKDAYLDPTMLATALRRFAADPAVRDSFKPEHLCGQIDQLIVRLTSNLDATKYSIEVSRITQVKNSLQLVGNYDLQIYAAYDEFCRQLDDLATQLQNPTQDTMERAKYAQHVIGEFEVDLRSSIDAVRDVKTSLLQII